MSIQIPDDWDINDPEDASVIEFPSGVSLWMSADHDVWSSNSLDYCDDGELYWVTSSLGKPEPRNDGDILIPSRYHQGRPGEYLFFRPSKSLWECGPDTVEKVAMRHARFGEDWWYLDVTVTAKIYTTSGFVELDRKSMCGIESDGGEEYHRGVLEDLAIEALAGAHQVLSELRGEEVAS